MSHDHLNEPPRIEALDALLREVDELRLILETDLTLAASAVESGSPQVAAEILGADRDALHRFEEHALEHLGALESAAPRRSMWSAAHAGPILVAAALVGVLAGVVPHVMRPAAPEPSNVAATDSLERIQHLAQDGDTAEVRAASAVLHEQLAAVVANASSDPAAAQNALLILSDEQTAIVRSGDSTALQDVLRQSQALVRAIVAALPPSARATAVPRVEVPSEPSPSQFPTASARPKPSPTASPTPTSGPSASTSPKPRATSSAHPSASPTPSSHDPYPLPSAPTAP